MDPYAPIHGISLERYAELGAELDGITDPTAQEKKVGELGISAADWNAAKDGWTARMQDMSLMGQVATKYMQLYNAALAKKQAAGGGAAKHCTFEDFCAISAALQVFGWEAAMNHYELSQGDWTTISAHWMGEMNKDPMNMGMRKNQMQEQEAARLRGGGQPKPVQFTDAPAGGGGGPDPFDPGAVAQQHMAAGQQQAQHWQAYSAGVLNTPGIQGAMGMLGAMNKLGGGDGLMAGRAVLVQWNDGNKYPATITQDGGAQMQVTFPNGSQMWIERKYLEPN